MIGVSARDSPLTYVFEKGVPLSPMDEAPDSSWLEKVSEESRDEDWSDTRIERDDVEEEEGEKDSGEKPNSLKYGCNSASFAVMR